MLKTIATLALAGRHEELHAVRALYESVRDPAEIARRQLARFNAHWQRAWSGVPFYRQWRSEHALPERIDSLAELAAFPVLTKELISARRELIAQSPGCERWTLTGGTSGLSTAFPMGRDDADAAWINTHVGRAWNGLEPGDRLFMIWGHSHLFSGKGAALKHFKRKVKDRLANIYRFSAYTLDAAHLTMIADEIDRLRPRYVIGYGSCLLRLCRHLAGSGRNLRAAGVTRVVNTSETMYPEDRPLVEDLFGCPVINEYGMAEAGVLGYSSGAFYPVRVFWNDFVVRTSDRRILVSTLGKRCFPLVNYDTEDLSDATTPATGSILHLDNLLGKARDILDISDAHGARREVSVVLFDHILKQIPALRSMHYELSQTGELRIHYTTDCGALDRTLLGDRLASGLRQEDIQIDPAKVDFVWLEQPLQTAAGKRRTIVRPGA